MKIAVLSGKGGAGKTMTAVNLAAAAENATYVDCDVEEPNGRLFLKSEKKESEEVFTEIPVFDKEKCIGCRKCVNFCRFNALVYIKDKPKLFPDICHSCGGCEIVCPVGAVSSEKQPIGIVEKGKYNNVNVVTGVLNMGESSGIPVIKAAVKKADEFGGLCIIDCPPGSACPVMESVTMSDYCIIVAEPTAFGFHNFKMVYELVKLLHRPYGIIINKMDEPYKPLEDFCKEYNINVLAKIPYSTEFAKMAASGQIICEHDKNMKEIFKGILKKTGGEAI